MSYARYNSYRSNRTTAGLVEGERPHKGNPGPSRMFSTRIPSCWVYTEMIGKRPSTWAFKEGETGMLPCENLTQHRLVNSVVVKARNSCVEIRCVQVVWGWKGRTLGRSEVIILDRDDDIHQSRLCGSYHDNRSGKLRGLCIPSGDHRG